MDPIVMRFAQMAAVFLATCATLGIGLLALSLTSRLLKRVASTRPAPPPLDDQRLLRLEQAVDSIAVEVERISESQRFIAKLLDERSPVAARLPPS